MGLSREEAVILEMLQKTARSSVTGLADSVKIPRTTVHFLLKKLKKRGFVEQIKIGGHYEWKIFSQTDLSRKLRKLLAAFELKSDILGGIEGDDIGVEVYKGKEKIKEIYKNILKVGNNERVYVIQGNKSAKKALQKIDKEYFFDFHKAFKKRRVIMEGVIGESTLEIFKRLTTKELESHSDRLIITHVVPDQFVDFNVDIIMYSNSVFIVNIEEENIIFIKNISIIQALKSLLSFMQANSEKIDLNAYIKQIIENKFYRKLESSDSPVSSG